MCNPTGTRQSSATTLQKGSPVSHQHLQVIIMIIKNYEDRWMDYKDDDWNEISSFLSLLKYDSFLRLVARQVPNCKQVRFSTTTKLPMADNSCDGLQKIVVKKLVSYTCQVHGWRYFFTQWKPPLLLVLPLPCQRRALWKTSMVLNWIEMCFPGTSSEA